MRGARETEIARHDLIGYMKMAETLAEGVAGVDDPSAILPLLCK